MSDDPGIKFVPIKLRASDLECLDVRRFEIDEIAPVFSISPVAPSDAEDAA